MKSKSASVKLFKSIPYISAPKSTLLDAACLIGTTRPVVLSACGRTPFCPGAPMRRVGASCVIVAVGTIVFCRVLAMKAFCKYLLHLG